MWNPEEVKKLRQANLQKKNNQFLIIIYVKNHVVIIIIFRIPGKYWSVQLYLIQLPTQS